jgi:hypothetical protein
MAIDEALNRDLSQYLLKGAETDFFSRRFDT